MISKRRIPTAATHLFACGESAGRWMFGSAPFRVVRNGVDVSNFAYDSGRRASMRRRLDLQDGQFAIGHVGRFDKPKNHEFLVQVFADVLRQEPDARLILVGEGPLRQSVEGLAHSLGVAQSVRFLGLRSDVADLMQAFDVFCMPSIYEGLPLVLVEAQSAGLPCVISDSIPPDCGIVPSLIHRLSLTGGTARWSQILTARETVPQDRSRFARLVQAAGYDSRKVAKDLERFYLSGTMPE